jgi:small subunit ribosomal protein S20
MPNIKSSKKRVKIGHRNTERNNSQKSSMRTAIRMVRDLALAGNSEEALASLPAAFSKIDKAIKRKIIHKNAGARLKARLTAKIKAAQN